jgi:hypothetical protein
MRERKRERERVCAYMCARACRRWRSTPARRNVSSRVEKRLLKLVWGVPQVETFVFLYKHKESWDDMLYWAEKALRLVKENRGEESVEMATSLSNFGLVCSF